MRDFITNCIALTLAGTIIGCPYMFIMYYIPINITLNLIKAIDSICVEANK